MNRRDAIKAAVAGDIQPLTPEQLVEKLRGRINKVGHLLHGAILLCDSAESKLVNLDDDAAPAWCDVSALRLVLEAARSQV